jgi:hypothetical protein
MGWAIVAVFNFRNGNFELFSVPEFSILFLHDIQNGPGNHSHPESSISEDVVTDECSSLSTSTENAWSFTPVIRVRLYGVLRGHCSNLPFTSFITIYYKEASGTTFPYFFIAECRDNI